MEARPSPSARNPREKLLKQIRKRLTYANVMSSLAVFLILGGATAFAAIKKVGANEIKANSIKTGKIVKEAVTKGKIKNGAVSESKLVDGAVTTNKIADNAVTTGKIANDAVTGDKVKESTLSQVPSAKVAGTALSANSGTDILSFNGASNAFTTVQSLNVPGGNYVVAGKVLANNNSASVASAHCIMEAGGNVIDNGFEVIRMAAEGGADRQYLVQSGIVPLPSGGTIIIKCQVNTTEGNWLNRVITASQVANLG